jgi:hypothetical protein
VRSAFDLAPRLAGMPPLEEDDDGECRNLDAPPLLAPLPSEPREPRILDERMLRKLRGEPEPGPARFALWSDGTLEIRRGSDITTLSTDETRQLLRYLERLAMEEGA